MGIKDQLEQKPKKAPGQQAAKKVGLPPVEVQLPAINLNPTFEQNNEASDKALGEISKAMGELSAIITKLAKQQESILQTLQQYQQTIGVLASREIKLPTPEVKIGAPVVEVPPLKLPPRPSTFTVQIERPGEEPTTMRINAGKSH